LVFHRDFLAIFHNHGNFTAQYILSYHFGAAVGGMNGLTAFGYALLHLKVAFIFKGQAAHQATAETGNLFRI